MSVSSLLSQVGKAGWKIRFLPTLVGPAFRHPQKISNTDSNLSYKSTHFFVSTRC